MLAWLRERYLTVDTRQLALFRICFGLVLLYDVLRRVPHAAMFYSDHGVLPAWLIEQHPPDAHAYSPLTALSSPLAVQIAMLLLALVYLGYIVGFRTRLMQVLALVGFISLDTRNLLVENRGHIEMALALLWTSLLPLGDRWSLEARRRVSAPRPKRVTRLAMGAVTLQTAAIYLLNGVQKSGAAWADGHAVHYALWQNRAALPLAAWLRLHEPSWLSPLLSHGSVALEIGLALLVLSPFAQRISRSLFFGLALSFHMAIALVINVWPHSFVIMAVNILLLRPKRTTQPALRPLRPLRPLGWAREVATAALLGCSALLMARDNRIVRDVVDPGELSWLDPMVGQLRLFQSWSMFVPMPTRDGTLVIDARTADGKRLDPLTGSEPDFDAPLHGPFRYTQLQCDYYNQIRRPAREPHLPGLANYLAHYHRIEGRPDADRLVAFSVYWLSSDAPRPGSVTPTNVHRRLLLQSPAAWLRSSMAQK